MPLALRAPRLTAAVKHLLRIMLPGVFGAGVVQINLVVSTAMASLLPTGAVSYINYADRLNQLPLAIVGIAVGTAILPPLSRQVRLGDDAGAAATQNRGLELALLLTLPAAIALAVAAEPILLVLFQHGKFTAFDTANTAPALAAYAVGLPAFVLVKVMAPGFFARHDTKTPVKIAAATMAVNVTLTIGLGYVLAQTGIALALSLSGWCNALALTAVLNRRGQFALDAQARRALPRILALEYLLANAFAGRFAAQLAALAMLVGGGLAGFALLALGFGVADWRDLRRRFRRQAA
jgi:putative peptidoglycan lipid II flippase